MNLFSKLQNNQKAVLVNVLKLLLVGAGGYALFSLLQNRISFTVMQDILHRFGPREWAAVGLVTCLMVLHWGLEGMKWHLLTRPIENISRIAALKGVVLGATLGNLTPLMAGDFVGRLQQLRPENRRTGAKAIVLNHGLQFYVLLILAEISMVALLIFQPVALPDWLWGLAAAMGVALAFGLLFFFTDVLRKFPKTAKFRQWFIPEKYNNSVLLPVMLLALGRHLIFVLQYLILFAVLSVPLTYGWAFALVNLVFLVNAFGVYLGMFGDMITRQLSTVAVIGLFAIPLESVLLVSLLIWLINVFLPVSIGAVLWIKRLFALPPATVAVKP